MNGDGMDQENTREIATFCAGSFWDTEAAFRHAEGVLATAVGFMGGTVDHPSYEDVCSGKTGHYEVVMIAFDPETVTFTDLVSRFFSVHDPCACEQGGFDGPQYQPCIFYHDDSQRRMAEQCLRQVVESGRCPDGVVTRILPAGTFFVADECHQHYYEKIAGSYTVSQRCGDNPEE